MGIRRFLALFCLTLAALLPGQRANAGDPMDCGVVVLPPGIGIGPSEDITSLNPLFVDSIYNQQAAWLLYPELVWVNRFHQIDWRRSLASAITTPDGGQTYQLRLIRQLGETWPGYGGGGMPGIIKQLTVQDATHFTIELTHRANPEWFIYNGLTALIPLPEHAWRRYNIGQLEQLQSAPAFFDVVDGPLKIAKLDVGQCLSPIQPMTDRKCISAGWCSGFSKATASGCRTSNPAIWI
jgi:peptide/nickel transport system substrate-binding protein